MSDDRAITDTDDIDGGDADHGTAPDADHGTAAGAPSEAAVADTDAATAGDADTDAATAGDADDASTDAAAGDADDAASADASPRDAADQARRVDRLRRSLLAVDPSDLKRAVLALPQPSVEALAKAARVRVPVLRAGSIKSLRRVDDPVLLDLLAGLVSDDCLGVIRERLGDEADDPRPEAVRDAVDDVTEHEFPAATVRLTLAMVAAGLAEAADTCDALLDDDPRFELPDEVAPAPAPTVGARATSAASEEKRSARKARRAEEAERRRVRQEQSAAAAERRKADRRRSSAPDGSDDGDDDDAASPPSANSPADDSPVPSRRRPALTGDEAGRFNGDDPLVGSVVIAEIVFEPDDPDHEPGAKRRPCVVIGASPTQLLVRPGYSEGGVRSRDWMSYELRDWRAAGLDKPSWVETGSRRVDRAQADPPLGRLTGHDWNALW